MLRCFVKNIIINLWGRVLPLIWIY